MPYSNKDNMVVDLDELKEIMDNDMELIQDCFTDFISFSCGGYRRRKR